LPEKAAVEVQRSGGWNESLFERREDGAEVASVFVMSNGSGMGVGPAQAERGWERSQSGAKGERTFASVDGFAWRNAVAHFDSFARHNAVP